MSPIGQTVRDHDSDVARPLGPLHVAAQPEPTSQAGHVNGEDARGPYHRVTGLAMALPSNGGPDTTTAGSQELV